MGVSEACIIDYQSTARGVMLQAEEDVKHTRLKELKERLCLETSCAGVDEARSQGT